MSAFIKTVQNTAHTHRLWSKGSRMIVGVSGGADSVCLLDVLVELGKKYDWELRVAHVNYGLRGSDSDDDERLVRELAQYYQLPCSVYKPKITTTSNLEEVLRDKRYRFFETIRQKYDCESIAIAHTLNDQAETVLMRLIRGSGLSGLSAMQAKTNHIIRPFLEVSRHDILEYIKERKLTYHTDSSNSDTRFLRNSIRHKLIPYLQKNFNHNIQEVLANTARVTGEDYALLQAYEKEHLIPFQYNDNSHTLTFHRDAFLKLDQSIQKMTLRTFFTLVKGTIKGITSAHIHGAVRMLESEKSKIKTLSFGGICVTYTTNQVAIHIIDLSEKAVL